MRALQDKATKCESQNIEFKAKIESLEHYVDQMQSKMREQSSLHERNLRDIEYSLKEQLRLSENEKTKHLEANRKDREKFENTLDDQRLK